MVLFYTNIPPYYFVSWYQCIKFNAFTIWKSVKRISCCFFLVPLYTIWACYFTIFHKRALHFKSTYVTLNRKYHMYWCDMADEGISKRNQVSLPHSLRKSSNRSLLSSFHLPTNLFLISSIICRTPNLVSLMLLRLAVCVIKKKFNTNILLKECLFIYVIAQHTL